MPPTAASPPARPVVHRERTQIIVDWDDTILPTSFLAAMGLTMQTFHSLQLSPKDADSMSELDKAGALFFTKALQLARYVVIVTNAELSWVETSAQRFLPRVFSLLHQIEVISARHKHATMHPDSTDMWKRVEFRLRAATMANIIIIGERQPQDKKSTDEELFGTEPLLQLMCAPCSPRQTDPPVGWQFHWRLGSGAARAIRGQAGEARHFGQERQGALCGSHGPLKKKPLANHVPQLMENPGVVELRRQLVQIFKSFDHIVSSPDSLDLKLHPKPAGVPDSSDSVV